jgi:hypothetical protein
VTAAADTRRDGLLPMDVEGVPETFGDELALLAALQLRWHTRLSGHLENALTPGPTDTDGAVVDAWHAAADELSGTRLVLDHYRAEPLDEAMAGALRRSVAKEHVLLAAMAGRNAADVAATVAAGRALEERARATYRPARSAECRSRGRRRHGLIGWLRRAEGRHSQVHHAEQVDQHVAG